MRRSIIVLLLATAALVAWVFWRPVRRTGPAAAPVRAASAARASAPVAAPVVLTLARVETRLPTARGLCGTEIERPLRVATPRRVPAGLAGLGRGVPSAAAVVAATEEWGIQLPEGVALGPRVAAAEQTRREQEEDLQRLRARDEDDGLGAHARHLRALGRPREALVEAQRDHDRDPGPDSAQTVASLLDDTNQPAAARRVLESELDRATEDRDRTWLQAQLGFLCATRGDLACARTSTQELERLEAPSGLATFTRAVERTFAGQLEEARAAYLEALESDHDFATVNNLAEVEACLGRQADSRQRWVEALQGHARPERQAAVLAGLGLTYLREGDVAPAWITASAALVAGGSGSHATDARVVLSLAALTMGDLAAARAQVAQARAGDPDDDLQRRRCFAHPAEAASLRALTAEERGDLEGARDAWVEVARSGHAALAVTAREALGALCP